MTCSKISIIFQLLMAIIYPPDATVEEKAQRDVDWRPEYSQVDILFSLKSILIHFALFFEPLFFEVTF